MWALIILNILIIIIQSITLSMTASEKTSLHTLHWKSFDNKRWWLWSWSWSSMIAIIIIKQSMIIIITIIKQSMTLTLTWQLMGSPAPSLAPLMAAIIHCPPILLPPFYQHQMPYSYHVYYVLMTAINTLASQWEVPIYLFTIILLPFSNTNIIFSNCDLAHQSLLLR